MKQDPKYIDTTVCVCPCEDKSECVCDCDCDCRHSIRWILRVYQHEELQNEHFQDLSLEEAQMRLDRVVIKWTQYGSNKYSTFEECMRKNLKQPCSVLVGLHKCKCCLKHQTKRFIDTFDTYGSIFAEQFEECEK